MSASVMQQLDVFAQVVASGNIAISARELGISPALVVEAMNTLEDRLGFQLFAVTGGGVELTPAGRKVVAALADLSLDAKEQWVDGLLAHADDGRAPEQREERPAIALSDAEPDETEMVLVQTSDDDEEMDEEKEDEEEDAPFPLAANSAVEETQEETPRPITPKHFQPQEAQRNRPSAPAEPQQIITLASHPSIFSHFQEALVAFEQASPDIGIKLRLSSLEAGDLDGLFAGGEADIAYFYALDDVQAPSSRYAWSERISLFVSAEHKLARKEGAMADDLAGIPRVTLAAGNPMRGLIEQALSRNGLSATAPVLETDNLYEIMKYVEGHNGYFAAFGPMARDFGKMSGIARLAYAQGLPQVQVRQAVHPDMADNPAVLALAEFLFR